MTTTQSELEECKEQRERYHEELVAAENRLERSKSKSVQAMERKKASGSGDSTKRRDGDAEVKVEEMRDKSPAVRPVVIHFETDMSEELL